MLGMKDFKDTPVLPPHIKVWPNNRKWEVLTSLIKPVVDKLFVSYLKPTDFKITLRINDQPRQFTFPWKYRGTTVTLPFPTGTVNLTSDSTLPVPADDDLYNYLISFLRSSLEILALDQIIYTGNITVLVLLLKRLIPSFVGLSDTYKSKYAIECINYLTKTEHMMSPRDSARIKLNSFSNSSGKPGKNKAMDMVQETKIKLTKTVFRSLGAGKSETTMLRASKASPVVTEISNHLNDICDCKEKCHHGKKKSDEEDVLKLLDYERELRPFAIRNGRKSDYFPGINDTVLKHPEVKNKTKMSKHMKRNSNNAYKKKMQVIHEESDEEEDA